MKVQINSLTYLYEKESLSFRILFLTFVECYVCSDIAITLPGTLTIE